jgi:hypothetical protein
LFRCDVLSGCWVVRDGCDVLSGCWVVRDGCDVLSGCWVVRVTDVRTGLFFSQSITRQTPHATLNSLVLVLLMMGIIMPETC